MAFFMRRHKLAGSSPAPVAEYVRRGLRAGLNMPTLGFGYTFTSTSGESSYFSNIMPIYPEAYADDVKSYTDNMGESISRGDKVFVDDPAYVDGGRIYTCTSNCTLSFQTLHDSNYFTPTELDAESNIHTIEIIFTGAAIGGDYPEPYVTEGPYSYDENDFVSAICGFTDYLHQEYSTYPISVYLMYNEQTGNYSWNEDDLFIRFNAVQFGPGNQERDLFRDVYHDGDSFEGNLDVYLEGIPYLFIDNETYPVCSLAITYGPENGDDIARIYINGTLVKTFTCTNEYSDITLPPYISQYAPFNNGGSHIDKGYSDVLGMRAYNRVLSAAEIYNNAQIDLSRWASGTTPPSPTPSSDSGGGSDGFSSDTSDWSSSDG